MNKYKSYRSWLESRLGIATRQNNMEMQILLREMLSVYNSFNPRKQIEVEVEGWKGKSSFELIKMLDGINIIKYQKPAKGEQPKKIETFMSKEELTELISIIQYYDESGLEKIPTRVIAMSFSKVFELKHQSWKEFFADRNWHNKLTLMLGALDSLGLIEYKGGKTKLLNKNISIQLIL